MGGKKFCIPKRRFKEFQNADAWEQCKFGELADYKKGPFGSALKKEIFVPESTDSVKVYEQQNAIKKDWKLSRYFITKKYAEDLNAFETHGGDIIISCAGTIGEMYELPEDSVPGVINQALMRVRINNDLVDKSFYQILFLNMIDDFSKEHSNGSAMKNIPPFADLKPMEALIPKMEEQKKITAFYTNIDNLITLHQRKLEKMKSMKAAYLTEMFPQEGEVVPKRRFAGFTYAWEQRKLGELSESTYGGGTPRTSNDTYWNGEIPWIQSSDLTEHQISDVQPRKYISESGLSNSATKLVPENSIAIVTRVGVGKLAIMPFSYTTSQDFLSLGKIKTDVCFTAYLLYKKLQAELNSVQGTSIKGITKEELLAKTVLVPEHNEQVKIGLYFHNLDNLITLHQRKLDKLQNIKKAYLNEMFI